MAHSNTTTRGIYTLNGVPYNFQFDTMTPVSAFENSIVYPSSAGRPEDRGTGIEQVTGGETNDTITFTMTVIPQGLLNALNTQQQNIATKNGSLSERRGKIVVTSISDPNQQTVLESCVPSGAVYQESVDQTVAGKWVLEFRGNLIQQFTEYNTD